jgi:hypothetical protein
MYPGPDGSTISGRPITGLSKSVFEKGEIPIGSFA